MSLYSIKNFFKQNDNVEKKLSDFKKEREECNRKIREIN